MGGSAFTFIYILVIFVLLYFMMIRPQKKQLNARNEMLNNLAKGDHVSTVGGINGYIRAIKENVVYLEIADGLIIEIMKSGISGLVDEAVYDVPLDDSKSDASDLEHEDEEDNRDEK